MSLFRSLTFHNISVSDDACIDLLMVLDGVPLSSFVVDGVTLMGEGR